MISRIRFAKVTFRVSLRASCVKCRKTYTRTKTFEEAWQELVEKKQVADDGMVRALIKIGWDVRGAVSNGTTEPGDSWAFHRHLILWAELHYPMLPPDGVEAMRVIMAEVAWVDLECVSRADATGFIIDAFCIYVRPNQQRLALRNWLTDRLGQPVTPVDAMISALRHTLASELPPLGEKDLRWHQRAVESEEDRDEDRAGADLGRKQE